MKIGVNCYALQANIGGLKQYFFNLFDWLLENDRENEYVFFHFQHNLEELNKLAPQRWRPSAILLDTQDEIANYFGQLDLYFCPFSVLWPRPAPIPTVMTLVDIQEKFYPQFFSENDLFQREYHFLPSTRAADCVLTISEFSKKTIAEDHRIPLAKLLVAHLCASPLFYNDRAAAESIAPFDDFLIFPANWWLHKNHDLLLRAMVRLRDNGLVVNAVLTGFPMDGGYPVADKLREFGLEKQVHIAGYVTTEQLDALYRKARMMVFPSLFEGFGMPPLEAMAAGCPVAASSSTCIPEVCGDAAAYFDPKSVEDAARAIGEVWRDEELRKQMISRGHIRAGLFSQENLAKMHLRAFLEAKAAYSPARYRWHLHLYQPFHRRKVQLRRRLKMIKR